MNRTINQSSAEAAWQEHLEHQKVMRQLEEVKGFMSSYVQINGNCYYWATTPLSYDDELYIARRGNHEEIMEMIHRYAKVSQCPEEKRRFCDHVNEAVLLKETQKIIAERGDYDEIIAYQTYRRFCAEAQDIILKRGDAGEIAQCINLRSFDKEQQRHLKTLNHKLYLYHILKHGLDYELVEEMLNEVEKGGDLKEYYDFIERHEFCITHQKRMLSLVKAPEFMAYISKHGFWEDVHVELVSKRSVDELDAYIKKHQYLSLEGEQELAKKLSHQLNMTYINYKYISRQNRGLSFFLFCLMKVSPIDYKALESGFAKVEFSEHDETRASMFMKVGSHEEVMAYFNEGGELNARERALLYRRNNRDELDAYINTLEKL